MESAKGWIEEGVSRKAETAPEAAARPPLEETADQLLGDLRALIEEARARVAQAANAGLVILYWEIGRRVREELLRGERAEYGKRLIASIALAFTAEYGSGFTRANLFHMVRFAEAFPDRRIVYALGRQLGWSHFR